MLAETSSVRRRIIGSGSTTIAVETGQKNIAKYSEFGRNIDRFFVQEIKYFQQEIDQLFYPKTDDKNLILNDFVNYIFRCSMTWYFHKFSQTLVPGMLLMSVYLQVDCYTIQMIPMLGHLANNYNISKPALIPRLI